MPSRRKDASSAQDEEEARERKKPTLVNIRYFESIAKGKSWVTANG